MVGSPYVLGYPRAALRALRNALPAHLAIAGFTMLLAWGWREALAVPPPRGWRTPAGWILGTYTVACTLAMVWTLLTRFGLRVVPRFERPLATPPDTYSHGRTLARKFREVDRLAVSLGAVPLLSFGLEAVAPSNPDWHDCSAARGTLVALLNSGPDILLPRGVESDLHRIQAALATGESEGVRFRLEVVEGDAMNARFWNRLRQDGYL